MIEERYFYQQQISLNDSLDLRRHPSGKIRLVLPYDGEKYFTRQAHQDVVRARNRGADRGDALVGFLAFNGYEKTNLGTVLNLDENHASYPIEMRLPGAPRAHEADPLLADNISCAVTMNYEPGLRAGQVIPVRLDIEIRDPDNADIPWPLGTVTDGLGNNIMRQVDFEPNLSLRMTVSLNMPRIMAASAHVKIKEVFIGWPTRTSLSSLKLRVANEDHQFQYNPERGWHDPERDRRGGLEWHDVPMVTESESEGGDIRVFRSAPMVLFISKPGDLYHQDTLVGQVEVTVDRLLSGTDVRLFDATGKLCRQPVCQLESVISTEFSLTLDDAFARRTRSPYQQMYFDEVILTEARIDDIATALRNRGFTVRSFPSQVAPQADSLANWWLIADRTQAPDTLSMLIYVSGKRYRTRRQRQVHGGVAYHTTVDSGDLQLYVYGFLRGDSKAVVQEMNALRRALHERFDRLPDRR